MKNSKQRFLFAALALALTAHGPVFAGAPCDGNPSDVPADLEALEATYANNWDDGQIADFCNDFGIRSSGWNSWRTGDVWGWSDPGNPNLPLGRTFNALWVFRNSEPGNDPLNFLTWGYGYAADAISSTYPSCVSSAFAETDGFFLTGKDVTVYNAFWWQESMVERAGTLFHEGRHAAAGKSHNCNPRSAGSDSSCDSDWAYDGATTYQVEWLNDYYLSAVNTTPALQEKARDDGNARILGRFCTIPALSIPF
jgi:hypothetical protein